MLLSSLILATLQIIDCVFRIPLPVRAPPIVQSRPPNVQSRPPVVQSIPQNPYTPPVVEQRPFISAPPPSPTQSRPFVSTPPIPQFKKTSQISIKTKTKTYKTFTRAFEKIIDYTSINRIHIMFSSVSLQLSLENLIHI